MEQRALPDGRPPFGDFDERLKQLREGQPGARELKASADPGRINFGSGLQAGIEILAGVGGGLLIGYALDRWLETAPLFLIVFFVLGSAAGMLNAYRWLRRWSATSSGEERGSD